MAVAGEIAQLEKRAEIGLRLRVDHSCGDLKPRPKLSAGTENAPAAVDSLFRQMDRVGDAGVRFEADAAAIWALQGNKDEALATLELAIDRGWTHSGSSDLRDIADEPAFRSLHGQPRFESLRARLAAHFARERSETEALGL